MMSSGNALVVPLRHADQFGRRKKITLVTNTPLDSGTYITPSAEQETAKSRPPTITNYNTSGFVMSRPGSDRAIWSASPAGATGLAEVEEP